MGTSLHASPPTETPKSVSTPPQGGSYAVARSSQDYSAMSALLMQGTGSATASSPLEGEPNRHLSDLVGGKQ